MAPCTSYCDWNIVSRFSRFWFYRRMSLVKMLLVPQFFTENFESSLIRKRKQSSTIACSRFSSFGSMIYLSILQVFPLTTRKAFSQYFSVCKTSEAKLKKLLHAIVEKTFLYRLRRFSAQSVEFWGTSSVFGDTYFFPSKIFLSFFLKILIGWIFDTLLVRSVSIWEKNPGSISHSRAEIGFGVGGGP